MDYEKKYKNALEWARQVINGECGFIRKEVEEVFPELKESEDERIRKGMLQGFKDYEEPEYEWWKGVKVKECIAWLEKQCDPVEINPSEFDLRLNRLLKQFKALPKEGLESSLSFYLNVIQNDGTYKDEKPFDYENCNIPQHDFAPKSAMEAIKEEKVDNANKSEDTFGDVEQKVFDELLGNGEQLWSEEDERLCQCLIRDQEKALDEVRNDKYGHSEIISDLKEMYRERIDWLESLKQRLNK